ncbi:MAG: outer membrane beta-barrel protein [Oceanicaulis sp.]
MSLITRLAAGAALAAFAAAPGFAQQYVSASAGLNMQSDSDNSGRFTSDFTTGDGVAVPPGTVLPSGTSLGWTTEFDSGLFLSAAYGYRFQTDMAYGGAFRIEGEISYANSDVDTHTGVTAGGNPLGAADAAVLITGSAPLGVTVADLVADGQGEIKSVGYAINGYYDLPIQDTPFTAYAGLGVGLMEVDIDYSPSNTPIIDDSDTVGFYQVMLGGSYAFAESTELFAGYRWRQSGDLETESVLVPASLDIENKSHVLELGVRYSF